MKQLGTIKGAILFTDIKNFTLKTSLLTAKQIEELLNKLNDIIFPIISNNNGKIIKSLGDSYMILFTNPQDAVFTSVDIQNALTSFNSHIKFDLFKIELRITIDYGSLEKKFTIKGDDYFGETVNLASRLQSITDANKIYITGKVYEKLTKIKNIEIVFLGKTSFKGLLFNPEVYSIIFDKSIKQSAEKQVNGFIVTNEMNITILKIDNIIFKYASIAAVLGIQPVPFLDIYALLPLHLYLLKQIANEYGIQLNKNDSKEIITTVMGSISGSYLLSQGVVGLSKIGLLGFGGYIMITLNFALTYAMGKILSYYLYKKSRGIKSTNKELNNLFKYSITSGKDIAKRDKQKILDMGKEYKNTFLEIIKEKKTNFTFIKKK